ncbi:MAG: RIP metalloprotease RseP [Clostridia bacterium]|nr:RIP metalloprotease RseP [Clostridia bacterium]
METFLYAILAIFIFLIIIMVHELGHFLAAKFFKVKVPEFSIGFGPVIFQKHTKETDYSLRAFPLGGYVKMEGEDEESDEENALCNKPVWQRLIIVAAGAVINLIMGFVIYIILFMQITSVPVLRVESLEENTPAYRQMMVDDTIIAVNGKRIWYYKDFKFLINTVSPEKELTLTVKRQGEKVDVKITPQYNEENNVYLIGINMAREKLNFFNTLKYAIFETFYIMKVILYSFSMLITGGISIKTMSGPIGTVNVMTQAAKSGLFTFFNLFAMLTVNIGIFNLLPLPALDGGRVFFMFIELIRGKPIDPKKEGIVHFIGLVLLVVLMVFVTFNDLSAIINNLTS